MKYWNFAFKVSIVSYLIFLVAEYLRPGFVSFVGSVHWWFIPVVICFMILLNAPSEASSRFGWVGTALMSMLFFFLVLLEGGVFEDFFLLVLFGATLLPVLLCLLLNQEEK